MKTADFSYQLPPELIAQEPLPERTASRMMVVHRETGEFEHRHVADLPEFLRAGDLLVVNDTRVFPARVYGRMSDTGGRVELLLLEDKGAGTWEALYRASRHARQGTTFALADGRIHGKIVALGSEGRVFVELRAEGAVLDILEKSGFPPVPPYIKRESEQSAQTEADKLRYQTVYARAPGAVAAPTAGLHFTPELFSKLEEVGVERAAITLHVGVGTFRPVKTDEIEAHVMEPERYEVGADAAAAVNAARKGGGRVVAVGSTTVRTLETVAMEQGTVVPWSGRSSLFIYPPFEFKVVDCMLTNFHLPQSTLIMMVSALADRDLILRAYEEAIRQKYRFYSYGDCMLIL